jgi:hypothetical protein
MPHHCADALSYQYHGILGFLTSQEGGRLIEIVSALTGTYAVAPRPIRRGLVILSWTTTFAILTSALSDGTGAKVTRQLSPCFSAPFANAAPGLISAFGTKERTASHVRGGFFLLLALMFSLLLIAFREQQCNQPR